MTLSYSKFMSEEERKRMHEAAGWLNTEEGYLWARAALAQVSYGRYKECWYAPFFQFKFLDMDVSGSSADFCVSMHWGSLPGDDRLKEAFERGEPADLLVY